MKVKNLKVTAFPGEIYITSGLDRETIVVRKGTRHDVLTIPCPRCGWQRVQLYFHDDRVTNCAGDEVNPAQPILCYDCLKREIRANCNDDEFDGWKCMQRFTCDFQECPLSLPGNLVLPDCYVGPLAVEEDVRAFFASTFA